MKRTVLFTALALAFGSAAYAQPPGVTRYDQRYDRYDHDRYDREGGVRVFGHIRGHHYARFQDTRWYHDRGDRWQQLSRPTAISREFDLMGENGPLNVLRLEAVNGPVFINRVTVEFMNGETQILDLNERLLPGQGDVIDLSGENRRVKRVMVYPSPRSRGEYAIFGA